MQHTRRCARQEVFEKGICYMMDKNKLILPVYLNENIVMDMLAIIEDGFSMVSEITSSSVATMSKNEKANASFSTSELFGKLWKIDLDAGLDKKSGDEKAVNSKTDKIHTSTSLLSKFRSKLIDMELMKSISFEGFDITELEAGDFIEVTGELMKNPMVNILEKAVDVFRMAEIFSDKPELGSK